MFSIYGQAEYDIETLKTPFNERDHVENKLRLKIVPESDLPNL